MGQIEIEAATRAFEGFEQAMGEIAVALGISSNSRDGQQITSQSKSPTDKKQVVEANLLVWQSKLTRGKDILSTCIGELKAVRDNPLPLSFQRRKTKARNKKRSTQ
jgi:hypothetical protein